MNLYYPQITQEKLGRDFFKKKNHEQEWTGKAEIIKEEIPGSKRSMCGYVLTYSTI